MNNIPLSRILTDSGFVRIHSMNEINNPEHKAGYVAVVGKPNVGKSSLVNAFLGQKIAAVTSKAQTTRRRQLGILSDEFAQIIFTDTPGLHEQRNKLGRLMNAEVSQSLVDADLILMILDASQELTPEDESLVELLKSNKRATPIIVVANKSDLIKPNTEKRLIAIFEDWLPNSEIFFVSALTGAEVQQLKLRIVEFLPESPPFYDEDQITDLYERQIAADLIRESALNLLRDEIPHGLAVRIDDYLERGEKGARIEATLFVERESHKAIVIGRGGEMAKKIGSAARVEIEKMSGRKVYLQLRIKVRKNWRNDEKILKRFGYKA